MCMCVRVYTDTHRSSKWCKTWTLVDAVSGWVHGILPAFLGLEVFMMQKVGWRLNLLYKKLVTLVAYKRLGGWRTGEGGKIFTVVFTFFTIYYTSNLTSRTSSGAQHFLSIEITGRSGAANAGFSLPLDKWTLGQRYSFPLWSGICLEEGKEMTMPCK